MSFSLTSSALWFAVLLLQLLTLAQGSPVTSSTDAEPVAVHTVFKSKMFPDVSLRFVKNSGVCEATPGVDQISGYIDVGTNMSMWFWFFEARQNSETAPFTLWINGGPGCASEIGLFQEHGPCTVNPDGQTTTLNPFSWNNLSNMIYIDQPIGTGFSFGTISVNSTRAAAPFMWTAFQVLFESQQFAKFESREFIFTSESYGGHYMPAFITYFDQQNELIKNGTIEGEPLITAATLVNNGWFDPLLANKAYVDMATFAPGYGQLQNDSVIAALNEAYFGPGGCEEQELACYAAGTGPDSNAICRAADNFCIEQVLVPAVGDRDINDLRQTAPGTFPPSFYLDFLANKTIKAKIGVDPSVEYSECSDAAGRPFDRTGDDARTFLPELSKLADSGLRMLIWAGDADINCNWLGVHATLLAMDWFGNETLHNTPFTNMTIDGKPVAAIQNVGNFSFARVYEAGHEVPAFQPEASLEIFKQIINKEPLHSV